MHTTDICNLPVKDIADDNCILFLWATFPKLHDAFEVITAWGFTYKTVGFVWVKQNRKSDGLYWGMGMWTRSNAEICLIATKGRPERIDCGVHQVIISHVEEHSKKPDETRTRILQLIGDLPRVELFARQTPPDWDVWGNQVDSTITL
jgi:N6-adenosine-specific RNA methylase IME4